ncbi:MAG: preprotein translocase subunit SecE [Candidatus Ancillula sp.]|jgi:preprotein translocase subunit SecE|nr:preprotein translocase subunit SecE [Candidatus Ancillula sp.]
MAEVKKLDKDQEKALNEVPVADKSKDAPVKDGAKEKKQTEKLPDKEVVKKLNIFQRFVLFIRQIIDELKKVTAPTLDEWREYVVVVLVFVLIIMLFITGVDYLIGQGVMALFAK